MKRFLIAAVAALALVGAALATPAPAPALAVGLAHTVVGPVHANAADGRVLTLTCPLLEKAAGGGYEVFGDPGTVMTEWSFWIKQNRPSVDGNGWVLQMSAMTSDGVEASVRMYVVCATI